MAKEYIYENITELITPVGFFAVYDGNLKIPFSVVRNTMDVPCDVYDDSGEVVGTIHSENNLQIIIESKDLQIGKEYIIEFSHGQWEYCDSDEHTVCYCTTVNNWVVGIGAYDPCDEQKDEQMWEYSEQKGILDRNSWQKPPSYDESRFEKYTIEALDDFRGFRVRLVDYKAEYILIQVAWLQVAEFPVREYESAMGLWLC